MKTKDCKIGETEFVDEKTIDKNALLGINREGYRENTKIKDNIYQCKGTKVMKGDIYGTK